MASRREEQQEEVRFLVMRLLEQNPRITTRELAKRVGISNGAAYYCLSALIEKGFVKLSNYGANPNKHRYLYILTPKGIREKSSLTIRFLERKRNEYSILKAEIEMLETEVGERGDNL